MEVSRADMEREALWAESVRRHQERQRQNNAAAWFAYETRMAEIHAALSAEHQERAERLAVNGHDKEGT